MIRTPQCSRPKDKTNELYIQHSIFITLKESILNSIAKLISLPHQSTLHQRWRCERVMQR